MIFNQDIIVLTKANSLFRHVLETGEHAQIAVMCIPSGVEAGERIHESDETLVFVEGEGEGVVAGDRFKVAAGHVIFVRSGTVHNFRNTGKKDLKLYAVYAPPELEPGTIHATKEESDAEQEIIE